MGEKHKVLERLVDRGLSRCVHLWGCVSEKMEELKETSDGEGFVLLGLEESLLQVHILDYLEGYKLGHVE